MSAAGTCVGTAPRRWNTCPARPATRNLRPAQILDAADLVAEPAAHLRAGVARGEAHDVEFAEQLRRELIAAAMLQPGEILPRVQAEGKRGEEGKGGVLADVVIDRRVPGLDGVGLHRVQHLEARHHLARRKEADLEAVLRQRGHALRDALAGAEQHVEAARKGRGHPPAHLGARLRDGRGGEDTGAAAEAAAAPRRARRRRCIGGFSHSVAPCVGRGRGGGKGEEAAGEGALPMPALPARVDAAALSESGPAAP